MLLPKLRNGIREIFRDGLAARSLVRTSWHGTFLLNVAAQIPIHTSESYLSILTIAPFRQNF